MKARCDRFIESQEECKDAVKEHAEAEAKHAKAEKQLMQNGPSN